MMSKSKLKYFNIKIFSTLLLIGCSLLLQSCATTMDIITDDDTEYIYYNVDDIITDQEMERVKQIKLNATGIVKKAFDAEERHRKLTRQEIHQLLGILKERFKKSGLSVSTFEDMVLERINRDFEIIKAFNERLAKAEKHEKDFGQELCRQNQLLDVIIGSEYIVDEYIEDITDGVLPEEFEKSLFDITRLEHKEENEIIRGSFKSTCLKGAIVTMLVALNDDHANASTLNLPKRNNQRWVDYSIVFHTIPMPGKINKSLIHPDFESFTYYYKDATSPSQGELGFPHSGYFGHSDCARKPQKGTANPENCSSWVFREILKANYAITTYDVMQFFRNKTNFGLRDSNYTATPKYHWLNDVLTPVPTKNFQTAVKPGYLVCVRRPEEGGVVNPSKHYGASGHMAIALFATDTHIVVLACSRDVPIMEGIGVQKISLEAEKNSDIMILRYK